MKRRDFMKALGFAGLALSTPLGAPGMAQAQDVTYDGTFWITVNASGGWDPTLLCDPKGRANEEAQDPVNMYFIDEIGTAGELSYAPVGINGEFFSTFRNDLLVINGVDTSTNGHDSGSRNTWSGSLSEGQPSFAAMAAAAAAPQAPMSYISNGGYDFTAGLVARTRSGNADALLRIAYPNQIDPNQDTPSYYHMESAADRIADAQAARLERLQGKHLLPRSAYSMDMLFTARLGRKDIGRLTEYLPDPLDNSNNRLRRQAQVAIAAYRAGLAVSANLSTGGFDTHGNHDQNHVPRLQTVLEGVQFIMEEAERQGVRDKVVVMVGSDFGRTPSYNDGNGKDHWPITSVMLMGAGINGGRVIGGTTDRYTPMRVKPDTLETVSDDDPNGVRITPAHIHRELRNMAGIEGSDLDRNFPLSVGTPLSLLK